MVQQFNLVYVLGGLFVILLLQLALSFGIMEATHVVAQAGENDVDAHHSASSSCYKIPGSSKLQQQAEARSDGDTTAAPVVAPSTPRAPLVEEDATPSSSSSSSLRHLRDAAIVILAYNRPQHLSRTARSIIRASFSEQFAGRFISIDGNDHATHMSAKSFSPSFTVIKHNRDPPPPGMGPTFSLAAHYEFVFNEMFVKRKFSHLILFEDDMDVGEDIFSFFDAYTPTLNDDPSVWCISSWNDNAFDPPFELKRNKVFRSSYFPGLGWMLKRSLWVDDLAARWPRDNWDHWMRVSSTSKQRSCIIPFVSRNYNFGNVGSTASDDWFQKYMARAVTTGSKHAEKQGAGGDNFDDHDEKKKKKTNNNNNIIIKSSSKIFRLPGGDTTVQTEASYDEWIQNQISNGIVVKDLSRLPKIAVGNYPADISSKRSEPLPIIVPYLQEEYSDRIASVLNVHPFPRTHYKFVTWFLLRNHRYLFLIDRRMSPFAIDSFRVLPKDSLDPVVARRTGVSCSQACSEHKAGEYVCDDTQFDFINTCEALADAFPDCKCQQGWGEDIPNMEAASIHHPPPPNCLVTEMRPTCGASHPLTTRLCPCVVRGV